MTQRDWYVEDWYVESSCGAWWDAEFDDEDDPHMRRIRRECEKRVNEYEERLQQLDSDTRRELEIQAVLLEKATKDTN
jgi:hypothetical protein